MPQLTKFKSCAHTHTPITYTGKKCPLCANRSAAEIIAVEYFKVLSICGKLLNKLRKVGDAT